MSKLVDTRGLFCPQPVILTRAAMQEADEVISVVDNEAARYNVTRMAEKNGARVTYEEKSDGIYLRIVSENARSSGEPEPDTKRPAEAPLVVVVPADTMGRGDDELGGILIRGFLYTLNEVEPLPETIIFLNSGVRLAVEGSPVLDDLQKLIDRGVEILACGTCLGHFGLKEKLALGEVSNMYTIAETLLNAGKTVSV